MDIDNWWPDLTFPPINLWSVPHQHLQRIDTREYDVQRNLLNDEQTSASSNNGKQRTFNS